MSGRAAKGRIQRVAGASSAVTEASLRRAGERRGGIQGRGGLPANSAGRERRAARHLSKRKHPALLGRGFSVNYLPGFIGGLPGLLVFIVVMHLLSKEDSKPQVRHKRVFGR